MESVAAMKRSTAISKGKRDNHRLHPSPFHHGFHQLRQLATAMRYIAHNFVDGGSLLDYGCGAMPYKPVFVEKVKEYLGADLVNNDDVVDILLCPDGRLPVESGRFEIVLSTQVLEHVEDPTRYLAEVQRVLKENGILVLSTHGAWHYHPVPNDYWRWTSAGLRKIVKEAGFKTIFFKGIMGDAATATQLWQDAVLTRLPRWIGLGFKFVMQKIIAFQDKLISQESKDASACVYVIVARKISVDADPHGA